MFTELMHNIWDEFARYVFNVEVGPEQRQQQDGTGTVWSMGGNASSTGGRYRYDGGRSATGSAAIAAAAVNYRPAAGENGEPLEEEMPAIETVVKDERENIGRNDPCWCGSGKKFKKCHGAA